MPRKKTTGTGKTAKYYDKNPKSYAKKLKKDRERDTGPQREKRLKYKRELEKKRYAAKKKGRNIKGKDYDHKTKRFTSSKTNRSRGSEKWKSKRKRK